MRHHSVRSGDSRQPASMALQGVGVAWVPRVSVTGELARGERVTCGGEHWQVPLEIRLYRRALALAQAGECCGQWLARLRGDCLGP
jgi:DNA-binding transcriptional LysR family regulator